MIVKMKVHHQVVGGIMLIIKVISTLQIKNLANNMLWVAIFHNFMIHKLTRLQMHMPKWTNKVKAGNKFISNRVFHKEHNHSTHGTSHSNK